MQRKLETGKETVERYQNDLILKNNSDTVFHFKTFRFLKKKHYCGFLSGWGSDPPPPANSSAKNAFFYVLPNL